MDDIKNNKTVDGGRVYFVIDMKTFFASVECAERGLDPFKTNLVVADESRGTGGICLAVSPKMKSLGVKNRCRLYEIPKTINFIIAKPQMQKYIDYAGEIYAIYLKYIDKNDIHVYSIDECFIDVTSYLKLYKLRAKEFAIKLMKEIQDTLHIPSTTGIGTNLYLAKIALDITAKHSPERIGWLTEQKFKDTLWDYKPLTDFWQIADGTAKKLARIGITTMRGIATCEENLLYDIFGINAELLIDHSFGRETCTMADIKNYKSKSKSIGSSQVLPRNYDYVDTKIVLTEMIQSGCYELIRKNLVSSHIVIIIGYSYDGETREKVKFSVKLKHKTNLFSEMIDPVLTAFESNIDKSKLVRRVSYEFSRVTQDGYEQYDMFTDMEKLKKEKRLLKGVVSIQDKYGKNSILKGIDFEYGATQQERNKLIGGHNANND